VSKLQQAGMVGPEDEFLWTKQVRVQQTRMNREGKNKHQWEDDETQTCANALGSTQRRIPPFDPF
jgi:hypothetical protein